MTTACDYCHATTDNGLALCEMCQHKGATILEFLPIYFRNLARNRRPGRPNGSLGITNGWLIKRGETQGSKIAPALERAANDLNTHADRLAKDHGTELPNCDNDADTIAAICGVLAANLTTIATNDWAGQFLRDADRHERALRTLTETAVPGWYAGTCRQTTGRDMEGNTYLCGTDTYVVPGLTWITCGGCGVTTYARDHLDIVLEEARGWVAAPMRIAEAIVALVDTEISVPRLHKRISKWGERDQIDVLRRTDDDGDPIGPKRYRLGNVLDAIAKDGPTRVESEDLRAG